MFWFIYPLKQHQSCRSELKPNNPSAWEMLCVRRSPPTENIDISLQGGRRHEDWSSLHEELQDGEAHQDAITPHLRDPASPDPFGGGGGTRGKMEVCSGHLCTSIPTCNAARMWVVRKQYGAIYPQGVGGEFNLQASEKHQCTSYVSAGSVHTITATQHASKQHSCGLTRLHHAL